MLIPAPSAAPALSSLHSLSSHYFLLPAHFLPPGGVRPPLRRGDLAIRNGGGPRTFPGGVSKWQWKRMQAKKARQLLKARLARERQLYEMRKRTELRDAVAHLERPWDPDSAADASAVAPNLLSVAADDQLRALADRFHRPGGVDLWNDRDGPRVFASPATGAASARFFPKNAVHSVQPYALVSDAGEASATRARGSAADLLLLGRGDGGAQGVRENATETEDEAYSTGDDEPAVELMERDGTWEPANALDDGDGSIPGYWSSDDDSDVVPSESEDMGDVRPRRVPRETMLRRNGRNNGVARWEAAGTIAAGSNDDRGWSGGAFFSDSERARESHSEQRWQETSSSASTRKRASGRGNATNTSARNRVGQRGRAGAGSFSDSEAMHGGSEPKWRSRTKDGNRNGAGRWNAPRQDWSGYSNSDSERGSEMEPRWGAKSNLNGRENFRGRSKPKYSANTSDGDAPGRRRRANNGDEHQSSSNGNRRFRFGGSFAEGLEAPTWKPRRMNRARNNNGDDRDANLSGRFRRGDARQLQESPRNTNREDGRRMNRNGGQRFREGDYSLRPTSELHTSWREMGSDE
ncbi:hypothetical protein SETIT_1G199400v2 [Setaria italica]|uniref:DEAD-box ATP-dependent RNA helicase 33 n=1 Tax=Setaria italica TaxID=4555 RepID=K3YYC2_SETIT|nr:uncharacterized protein LOC101785010 [Setaria italica]RCV06888.1 hypothetical protein SETIT_1G199400v2 [Setaria italica]